MNDTVRHVSAEGFLKVLAAKRGRLQKVEVWLLNDGVDRNNERFENLEEHRIMFVDTPLLVAYVGDKIGDGHNFEQTVEADGSVSASFLDATAERIVGYFKLDKDIRIEEKDGKKWIVGIGYIWAWYAKQLVEKIKKQGLDGMSISIEALVYQSYMDEDTEVYTQYEILGTTILGDDVRPAVAEAHIRALSELGTENIKQMTLKVASMQTNKKTKGEQKRMEVTKLQEAFADYTVLADSGETVILMSENGELARCGYAEEDGNCVKGEASAVNEALISVGDSEEKAKIIVDAFTRIAEKTKTATEKITSLSAELNTANETIKVMQESLDRYAELERETRKIAVKQAIESRIEEIQESGDLTVNAEELTAEEKLCAYAEMFDKDGNFIGDTEAKKDVAEVCLQAIIDKAKGEDNQKFVWECIHSHTTEDTEEKDGAENSAKRILR